MVNIEGRHFFMLSMLFSAGLVFCDPEYAETGTNYTFSPTVKGKIETILWKVNNHKLVEYENNDLMWYRFKGRGNLDTESGKLTLMELMKDNSAQYQSEIQVNRQLQYSVHNLTVMDAVSEPKVTCDVSPEGIRTLHCLVPNPNIVEFEWSGPDKLTYAGQTLNVSQETRNESVYYCTAKNQVSRKATQFTLESCYPPPPPAVPVGIIIAVVVVVIVIILLVIAIIYKNREKIRNYFPVSTK